MKYFIKTYGCQMNVADSDFIAAHLISLGYAPVETPDKADVVIVNTCSVRQHPENAALSFIGRVAPLKSKNPDLKIIFAGCTAQRLKNSIKKRFPVIDLVIGAREIESFPQLWKAVSGKRRAAPPGIPTDKGRRVSAFVTIMRGCENYCSYCIVPLVRGPEISRPAAEIVKEIKGVVKKGVKEVTLLGQNVNSYKGESGIDFADLLSEVNAIQGLERIRFMTSHPKDLSARLISAIAGLDKVCGHLHLPLQAGSDRVLRNMNRGYTSKDYIRKISLLKKKIPGISITTDILVGFPDESDKDFKETIKVINKVRFDSLFGFKYSLRPDTKAAALADNVALPKKEKRLDKVLALGNKISAEKNAKLINTVQEVLVESGSDKLYQGSTRSNKKVSFSSNSNVIGRTVSVKITNVKINSLSGEIV